MTFASILIGLGVDYAIHYLEHYLELRYEGLDLVPALARTAGSVGSGILTCARRHSDVFLLCGSHEHSGDQRAGDHRRRWGSLLCVVAAFLSLPALVVLADRNVEPGRLPRPFSGVRLQRWVATAPWLMGLTAAAIVIGGGCLGFRIQDGRLGSRVGLTRTCSTCRSPTLRRSSCSTASSSNRKARSSYGVSIADTPQEARRRKAAFQALPSVGRVVELASAPSRIASRRGLCPRFEFQSRLQRILRRAPAGFDEPDADGGGAQPPGGRSRPSHRNEALRLPAMPAWAARRTADCARRPTSGGS